MTTHPDTPRSSMSRPQIAGAHELIAAVPAFLGFVPHRSLILIGTRESNVGSVTVDTVMRHDMSLPSESNVRVLGGDARQPVTSEMAEAIDHFADVCARNGASAAVAVIVDDRAVTAMGSNVDRRLRAVAARLGETLRLRGTTLTAAYLTRELVCGARWMTVTGPVDGGVLTDPALSPVALAYLLEGRRTHDSRETLKHALMPVDTAESREVAECMTHARRLDRACDRTSLESLLRQLASWAAEPPDRPAVVALAPAKTAEFGIALTSVMVRDSLLAMTLTRFSDIAEQLWLFLMKMLPAPERACPAALVGFSAYARGEGTLAALAIEIALDADPDYSLARLLERSLLAGARPGMIREVALSGYAVAELCGVRLPPPLD
ncbi:hypothetical protein BJF84_00385 [Rhodococcus sp. CUA-806]|nr:hypothetical protein BJF84_00385 [Rhodococcus sp. CUA-806]